MQSSFAEVDGFCKQPKVTRRAAFLAEMAEVVPWDRLEGLIEPYYPKAGNGRRRYPSSVMLRVRFLQHWYGYSDVPLHGAEGTVQCELDRKTYAKGIKVTNAEMATLNIESDVWHPEWNYTIKPRVSRSGNS